MKRTLMICVMALFLCGAFLPISAGAQDHWDQWQTIDLGDLTFMLPADWDLLDENIGFSQQEMAWYAGDINAPNQFLLIAIGEEMAQFLEIFIMDEDDIQIESDEPMIFLGLEGRKVVAFNQAVDEFGVFVTIEFMDEADSDLFLLIGGKAELYEESEPLIEQILASFTLDS